ncbi:hypothetical protein [Lactobacillus sp. ESL0677]|uniref:hypothetical protein n=1 Tax=Lactobacillus sp. ESL0677 TaxID=2983208 RepID=UPI0023F81F48|nr:hypothetical protein [Lactobacillus sp. ESL0677]WEV36199.1 hypothetical protein OZX76_05485 [Lactobacillus sp. ESL0677]
MDYGGIKNKEEKIDWCKTILSNIPRFGNLSAIISFIGPIIAQHPNIIDLNSYISQIILAISTFVAFISGILVGLRFCFPVIMHYLKFGKIDFFLKSIKTLNNIFSILFLLFTFFLDWFIISAYSKDLTLNIIITFMIFLLSIGNGYLLANTLYITHCKKIDS